MKSKKLTGLIALAVLLVLAVSGTAFAITPDPRFAESKWASYNTDSSLRYNCFMFARHVIYTFTNNTMFNNYTNNYRVLYKDNIGDCDKYQVGQIFNETTTMNASNLKSAFSDAHAGDVVQMYWNGYNDTSYSPNQHTFIISAKDDNGIQVLQSNTGNYNEYDDKNNLNPYYNTKAINNRYYSWSVLASMYSKAGSYGGCSIYHFIDYTPPDDDDLPWDGPQIFNDLTSYTAKAYTLENRTYEVYPDKFLRTPYSTSYRYTDGSEEDEILRVGKNSEGVYYAYISIPTKSGTKEVYVNLRDVFVAGFLDFGTTAYKECRDLYRRRSYSDDDSSYVISANSMIYPIYNDNEWVQIVFWDNGSNGGRRIAWLTRSKYDEITTPPDKPPVITTESPLEKAIVGKDYKQTLSATGATPITWDISGTLPPGLTFNKSTATLSGIPSSTSKTKNDQYDDYSFEIIASNKAGSTKKTISIFVFETQKISTSTLSDGYLNEDYSTEISATGSSAGMKWKVKDGYSLPDGLKLEYIYSHRTAKITGKPTKSGTFTFYLQLSSMWTDTTDEKKFTITISATPTTYELIPKTFPEAVVGKPYTATVRVIGGNIGALIIRGGAPSNFDAFDYYYNGNVITITGTPKYSYEGSILVNVADYTGTKEIYESYPFKIISPQIEGTIKGATVGQNYNLTLSANWSSTSYTWSRSGTLPPGINLSYSGANATFSGNPTSTGSYPLSLTVKDADNFSVTRTFNITVTPAAISPTITTSNASTFTAYKGETFSRSLSATGTTPITWSISSGSLPSGMTINSSTGTISGTPTSTGTYNPVVKATNTAGYVTKTFTIKVVEKPTITTSNTYSFTAYKGETFTQSLTATGTTPITWSISSGSLPSGMTINSSTGTISGTPTSTGTYNPTVKATNTAGSATKSFTIKVVEKPTITTSNTYSFTAYKGETFTQSLSATGTTPITWSISSGSLPSGLSINSSTGTISGTPTSTGTYSPTVKATNTAGSATKTFTIKVLEKPIITTSNTYSWTAYKGEAFSQSLSATGTTPITWSISSGSLPSGLSINSSTGTISGTVSSTASGNYNFTVKATNTAGSVTKIFTIKVVERTTIPDEITISGVSGSAIYVGDTVNITLKATGTTPITWNISSGSLPSGLSINSSTGTISGTATSAGTYSFTAKATNSAGYFTKTFTIKVVAKPSISGYAKKVTVGEYYFGSFSVSGGVSPYTWTLTEIGTTDISLSYSGTNATLSGTPTKAGTYRFKLKVTDKNGRYNERTIDVNVSAPSGIEINATNFPDSVFRDYVSKHFDNDSNGYLSDSEIADIQTIDVYGTGISSLKGIEYFTALTSLNCNSNDISELDVSKNTKLEYLYCRNTKLATLDLTKNTALKKLDVTGCSNLFKDNIYCDNSVEITGSDIVTPDIEIPVAMPEFRGATLILEGQIGVNFYMSLPEGYDYSNSDKYYVEFDIRGGTSNKEPRQIYNPNFKIVSNGETLYGFRCYINSAQMAEKITANFHFDGTIISNDDSVDDYLNRVINKNYPEKTRNLMNAIRDYGHYAQLMLSKANGWTIGERYAEMPAATEYTDADIAEARTNAAPYAVSAYKNSSGISRMGVSLNLDSETTLNISFTPADNYNGSVSATVDGKAYDSNILNRDRKVQIENIPANDLGKMYTVMLEANGVNTVTASALSYVSIVFNQTGSSMGNVDMDTMRRAVTALYRYYAATRAYFGTGE